MSILLLKPNGFLDFFNFAIFLDSLLYTICYQIKFYKIRAIATLLDQNHIYIGAIIFKKIGP